MSCTWWFCKFKPNESGHSHMSSDMFFLRNKKLHTAPVRVKRTVAVKHITLQKHIKHWKNDSKWFLKSNFFGQAVININEGKELCVMTHKKTLIKIKFNQICNTCKWGTNGSMRKFFNIPFAFPIWGTEKNTFHQTSP